MLCPFSCVKIIPFWASAHLSQHEATRPQCHGEGLHRTHPLQHRLWRKPLIVVAGWHASVLPINTFFRGYCDGSSLGHIPSSCRAFCNLGKTFQLLAVAAAPRRGSAHGWTRASLQAGGLSSSPAASATCCCVLIGTAENLALHLRHALISLWINNYWKTGLFLICFLNAFQILPFSNNKQGDFAICSAALRGKDFTVKYILI